MRPTRLELTDASAAALAVLAGRVRALVPPAEEVAPAVAEIIAAVRAGGDDAIVEFTRRFDSPAAPTELRVSAAEIAAALEALDPAVREGLEVAIANVRAVAEAERTAPVEVDLPQGQRVALREQPVRAAGVYAPGGRAAYPSTVVMCCVPARVAGVGRIAVATPPGPEGRAHPAVLAACALAGADEVLLMGGAQAIAALAYGTGSIAAVDLIAGPGNAYVQEAKRQVFGRVGIDGLAGPSELVVVAGEDADAAMIALDLAAQAEHGDESLVVLASPSDELIVRVAAEVATVAASRPSVRDAALALVLTPDLDAAVAFADALAPEHLELAFDGAEQAAERIRSAGCILLGPISATAFGDYAAGSNHVLPTGGSARFSGPLGAATFRRRQALVSLPAAAARALASHVGSVARAEGFPVHAESAEARARPG